MSQQTSSQTSVFVTANQAAAALGCHRKTFDEHVRRGQIAPAKAGHRGRGGLALFARADVEGLRASRADQQRRELQKPAGGPELTLSFLLLNNRAARRPRSTSR